MTYWGAPVGDALTTTTTCKAKANYIIVKSSWSLALIILSLKSTAHGYGIALISGNSSCQLLLLWGTWASLQSQEKLKPLWEWVLTKSSPSQFVAQTLFFLSFGPFQSTIFFREAKRPRELRRIQDSSERLQRQETRELRIQSPEDFILLFLFFFVVGHDFSFFSFVFLNVRKYSHLHNFFN